MSRHEWIDPEDEIAVPIAALLAEGARSERSRLRHLLKRSRDLIGWLTIPAHAETEAKEILADLRRELGKGGMIYAHLGCAALAGVEPDLDAPPCSAICELCLRPGAGLVLVREVSRFESYSTGEPGRELLALLRTVRAAVGKEG